MIGNFTTLLSLMLVLVVGLNARADYFLYTHISTSATIAPITSASQIQGSPLNASVGARLFAHFLLEITGTSTLYSYRFSSRFNADLLDYVARVELRPSGLIADPNITDSAPGPAAQSGISPLAGNFLELRRFDGFSSAPANDLKGGAAFHSLGYVEFTLKAVLLGGDLLVLPGEFEVDVKGNGEVNLLDAFLSEDNPGWRALTSPICPTSPQFRSLDRWHCFLLRRRVLGCIVCDDCTDRDEFIDRDDFYGCAKFSDCDEPM